MAAEAAAKASLSQLVENIKWGGASQPSWFHPLSRSIFMQLEPHRNTLSVTTDFVVGILECIHYAASWEDLRGREFSYVWFGVFFGSSHRF